MGRRDRERRPARSAHARPARPLILVVCEGEVTEPEYLRGFQRWCRNPRVDIEIPRDRGVPLTLVEIAIAHKEKAARRASRERDDNLMYDEVWVVYDVDEHPRMNEAAQLAEANGILRAVSNACFELWLLLHFRENPGAQHRDTLRSRLREYLPGYDKHLDMPSVLPGYEKARIRAERMDDDARKMQEQGRNPTTGVYRLTESIRGEPAG